MRILKYIAKVALNIPFVRKYNIWYKMLGIQQLGRNFKAAFFSVIGDYRNIYLHDNA